MDVSVREGRYYGFEDFSLDPMRRTLTRGGAAVSLTPTQFDTLLYLVEHPGDVVTRDQLLDAIWPRKTVDTANVSQTIFTLRRALLAAGGSEHLIATAPGAGYRFASPVQVLTNKSAANGFMASIWSLPQVSSGLQQPLTQSRIARAWPIWAGVAVVLLIVAGAMAAWFWRAPAGPPTRNVVVLGAFQNLARDPQFDQTFQVATQIDLQQSPYVQVLSQSQIADTLALMTRPTDAALTPAVAREVCERNNGAATVDGAVAEVGARYLLTLTATNCASGEVITADKAEVDRRDDLLPSLDRLVGQLRSRLGEPADSIRRFSAPLLQRRTASLAALQAYSQAFDDFTHGKRTEAIPLYQHAIALDPSFAAAYADLAVVYSNLRQADLAAAMIEKAYTLRDSEGEREQLVIRTRYNTFVVGDLQERLRDYQAWTQIYPNDPSAWANLSNSETWMGRNADAIRDGRRALAVDPGSETNFVVLARALLHAGRLDDARAVCAEAVTRHFDGDDLHSVAYQIDIARGDDLGATGELAWAAGKPGERTLLIDLGEVQLGQGQVHAALATFERARELGQSFGLGDIFSAPNARLLHDLGRDDLAQASLAQVPAGYDSPDYRVALAAIGDMARANALVDADIRKTPTDTLLTESYAPQVRAAEALRRGDPQAAIAALARAAPYEMRTFDVPYMRGIAYLAAKDGPRAAVEFRKVLDNRGVDAVSPYNQLAHLGLARALRLKGDTAGARKAYEAFFQDWRQADPGMPLLAAAKAEYAGLQAHQPRI